MEILLAGTIASVHFFQIEAVVALPACSIFNRPRSTAWATNNPPLVMLIGWVAILVNFGQWVGLCQLSDFSFYFRGVLSRLEHFFCGWCCALAVVRVVANNLAQCVLCVFAETVLIAQGAVLLTLESILKVHHELRAGDVLVFALARAGVPLVKHVGEPAVFLTLHEICEGVFENACCFRGHVPLLSGKLGWNGLPHGFLICRLLPRQSDSCSGWRCHNRLWGLWCGGRCWSGGCCWCRRWCCCGVLLMGNRNANDLFVILHLLGHCTLDGIVIRTFDLFVPFLALGIANSDFPLIASSFHRRHNLTTVLEFFWVQFFEGISKILIIHLTIRLVMSCS